MTSTTRPIAGRRGAPVHRDVDGDERVTPLELFFDLVFVLALTQCTTLIAHTPTWEGVLKGVLVLVEEAMDPEHLFRAIAFSQMRAWRSSIVPVSSSPSSPPPPRSGFSQRQ